MKNQHSMFNLYQHVFPFQHCVFINFLESETQKLYQYPWYYNH